MIHKHYGICGGGGVESSKTYGLWFYKIAILDSVFLGGNMG